MRRQAALLAALLTAAAFPAAARDIKLGVPVDCTLHETCYIQQYRDSDPTDGIRDFACGDLAYNGHRGTDFALPSMKAMRNGVKVIAAAPGTVVGMRDGVEDKAFVAGTDLGGQDCGNGVMIDHGGGWQTQYCHMRKGSVQVKRGDRVAMGAPLGLIGLSGRTQFPHLHLTVWRDGADIDPFRPQSADSCDPAQAQGLWLDPIPYLPAGLIQIGFSAELPEYAAVKDGLAPSPLPSSAPQLVLWAYGWGFRPGNEMRFELQGPEGFSAEKTGKLEKRQALGLRYFGKRLGQAGLARGEYTGTVTLLRGGKELSRKTIRETMQ